MRIDVYLAKSGAVSSRSEAQRLIDEGAVTIDGRPVSKSSLDVSGIEDKITVDLSAKKYVSRGGLKLKAAISEFSVDVSGRVCIDVGASSGGFTDCLLREGARHVIAVDSGSGQMSAVLVNDDRVTLIENYNARYMKPSDFSCVPELAVMDVSFISATYIIPSVFDVVSPGGDFICLIKPQFEVGRSNIGKGGIVRDDAVRQAAVDKVIEFAKDTGFTFRAVIRSPIKGGDGNVEFLAHFVK